MSDLATPSMPVPSSIRFPSTPPSSLDDDASGYAAKIKIRYLVEKRIDGVWVIMARLSSETDRMQELCEALGGRVEDIETNEHVIDQEFE